MRVRALKTGYYLIVRYRGDDTLGPGNGNVFTLQERQMPESDPKTGKDIIDKESNKPKTYTLTAEKQFSPSWMEKVDETTPETFVTSSQSALNIESDKMRAAKRPRSPMAS